MTVYLDFETRSTADIRKQGADIYARDPSTEVLCMCYAFDDEEVLLWLPEMGPPTELFDAIAKGAVVVAHNATFEWLIWNYVCTKRYGFPPLSIAQLNCTMSRAYAMAVPGSLDKSSAAMGLEAQKDMAGSRVMLQLAQPRSFDDNGKPVWYTPEGSPEKFAKLYAYCLQDVIVERYLHKRLMALSDLERDIWMLDQDINQRGIQIDVEAVKAALKVVELQRTILDEKMARLTGNKVASCSAVSQLTDWLKWEGVNLDGVAKADVSELLARDDLPQKVRDVLILRQEAAKSSTAKLTSMLNRAGEDGRIRGTTQYHGASTGRWAGRGIQVQNFPRPQISQDQIDEVFGLLGDQK